MPCDAEVAAEGYQALLGDLKERIRSAQIKAAVTVSRELVALYWQIGREIVERQQAHGWGTQVIDRLATDLRQSFPGMKGFSRRNLHYMRALAAAYPERAAMEEAVAGLPWGHTMRLLDMVADPAARGWYARTAVQHGWSRAILAHQVESDLYGRQGRAPTNFARTLPPAQSDLAREVLKDPYNFDFLTLGDDAQERDLERGLLAHIEDKRDHFAAIRPTIGMDAWRCTSSRGRMSECMRSTGAHASASPTIRSPVRLSHNLPRSVKGRTPSSTMATTSTTSLRRARQRPFQRSLRPTNKTLLTMSTGCTIAQRNGD